MCALQKMKLSSVAVINIAYTGNITDRVCNFKVFVFYYNNRFCNFSSCLKYFCNLCCCFWTQSAVEGLRIQPIIDLICVKFWILFLLHKCLSNYGFDMICYAKSESIRPFRCKSSFTAENIYRFCKFQNLFSDTETDSVICVISVGYFL